MEKIFILLSLISVCLATHGFGQSISKPITIKVDVKKQSNDIGLAFEKCSFIPLETSKECLFGRVALAEKHGDMFFLTNIRDELLMSFDAKGNFIANYVRSGKGPGELVSPMSFMIDSKNDNVVICSWDRKANLYFSLDGTFINEVPCSINNEGMVMLQDGSIAYYTGKPYNMFNNKPDYSWLIITDKQSNVSYKGLYLPVIKKSGYVLYQSFPRYKNEVYFKHPYADTIYKVDHQGPQPKYVFDFGKYQIDWSKIEPEPPIKIHLQIKGQNKATIGQHFFEFENWIFIDVNHGKKYYYALYNKLTGEVELYDPKTTANSKGGSLGTVVGATDKGLICLLEPLDLLYPDSPSSKPSDIKSNKELESIVSNLSETANPILMICEFK